MGRTSLAALSLVLVLAGCGGDSGPAAPSTASQTVPTAQTVPASISPVSTTRLVPPTQLPSTTATTAPSTTASAVGASVPMLLIGDDDGIRLVAGDVVTATFIDDGAVDLVLPDGSGGVVYQGPPADSWGWEWSEGEDRILYVNGGAAPIMHIREPGAEPAVVVADDEGRVAAHRVFALDGRPMLLYSVWRADDRAACGPDNVECLWNALHISLVLQDLDNGDEIELGIVAGFESSWVSYVPQGEVTVVLTETYGEGDVCAGVWSTAELLEAAGRDTWLGEGGAFWRRCDFGSGRGTLRAAVAPDSTTVAYIESVGTATAQFVVVDAVTGEELRRIALPDWGVEPAWIDWNGTFGVIADREPTKPLLILPDDTVVSLSQGWHVALWSRAPDQ